MIAPPRPAADIAREAWLTGHFPAASKVTHLSDREKADVVTAAFDGRAQRAELIPGEDMTAPPRSAGEIAAEAWETGYFPKASEVTHLSDKEKADVVRAALDGGARNSAKARAQMIEQWTDNRPARLYFRQAVSKTTEDAQLLEDIEASIDIVERHYDKIDATPSDPLQLVKVNCATHPEKGGLDFSEGLRVYRHVYDEDNGTVHIAGISGPHHVSIEEDGRFVGLEPGARTFLLRVAFSGEPPTKDQLIDDLCCLPLSRTKAPLRTIHMDMCDVPVLPNARDLDAELKLLTGWQEKADSPAVPVATKTPTKPVALPLPPTASPPGFEQLSFTL